jgi:excisionase family DNA binding protein
MAAMKEKSFENYSREPDAPVNQNSHDPERLAYRVEEVARQLDVNAVTVRRLVARRLLRRAPGLRHVRVTAESVRQYLRG